MLITVVKKFQMNMITLYLVSIVDLIYVSYKNKIKWNKSAHVPCFDHLVSNFRTIYLIMFAYNPKCFLLTSRRGVCYFFAVLQVCVTAAVSMKMPQRK